MPAAISEATVKTHLPHAFAKLGVDDGTAAVTTALERGILHWSWPARGIRGKGTRASDRVGRATLVVTRAYPHTGVVQLHIGLIGGIGPAATDYYYRRLIAAFAARDAALELTMVHADTSTLLRHLAADDREAQVAIYARLTARLAAAGAECVVVTSIAGHFCIAEFEAVSALPVINLVSVARRAIEARGLARIGILGTRTVMASRLYGQITTADVVPPLGADLDAVHDAYVQMAAAGTVTDAQRAVFDTAIARLRDEAQVEAILLGGTDLALVYRDGETAFPLVDAAALHVDAIVARALVTGIF